MKPLSFRLLAASSVVFLAAAWAQPVTRPRYGGTLRVEMSASPTSLDPAHPAASAAEAAAQRRLEQMLYDRLVRLDERARPLPQLAVSWSHDAGHKKWQFNLRAGAKLPDGTALTPQDAATSLAAANPSWRVTASESSIRIDSNSPLPGLPAELARVRNSILHRAGDGTVTGTGLFRLTEWQPGRRAVLAANDDYWDGRPYLDAVEVNMGRAERDQLIDLELGKADVIELGIAQLRAAAQENLRTVTSSPSELLAIVFSPGRPVAGGARLRRALALSIDRGAIHSILLQKQGEPTGGLLPEWLSGYAFLFPAGQDLASARRLRADLSSPATLTLGFNSSDPQSQAIAERIALNARDAGLNVRAVGLAGDAAPAAADARLVRLRLASDDLRTALAARAEFLHEPVAQLGAESAPAGELYEIERSLLADDAVIPLIHLPEIFAVSPRVREWSVSPSGAWRTGSVWLEMEKP